MIVDAYTHETVTVAALKRARVNDADLSPGQSVSYVVVDGGAGGVQRVRLDFETVGCVRCGLVRAGGDPNRRSVLSPLGWHCDEIKRSLATTADAGLASY